MRALRHDAQSLAAGSPRVFSDLPPLSIAAMPGHALVRVSRAGLDEADALVASGMNGFQGTLGHEFVGVVKEINLPEPADAVDAPVAMATRRSLVGRRVIAHASVACARCDMCRAGMSGHCRNRRVLGVAGMDGCLANEIIVPIGNLLPVSDRLDDERAVFAGVVARALHTTHLVRASGKSFVTVLGDNVLALTTAQVLSRLNKAVRLLGTNSRHTALCDRWGVKSRPVAEAGRRQDQDVVIDCTGSSWGHNRGVRVAMQLVRPRGTIILKDPCAVLPFPAGAPLTHTPEPHAEPENALSFWPMVANEVTLIGSREGPLADALDLLERDEVDVRTLIARKIKLDETPAALKTIAATPTLKVIVEL